MLNVHPGILGLVHYISISTLVVLLLSLTILVIVVRESVRLSAKRKNRNRNKNRKLVMAFDLDHTLIDSTHRTRFIDGVFDLQYWKDMSPTMIWDDKLLPLVSVYEAYRDAGFFIIAVTARDMGPEDFEFLKKHNLVFDEILHREDSKELDHVLKDSKLGKLFEESKLIPFQAYDDKQDNLEIFKKWGFRTFHAVYVNHSMSVDSRDDISLSPKDCINQEEGFEYSDRD